MTLTTITSDGITDGTIIGTDLATNIDLVDDQKLRLGTSQDLQIYHSNGESVIKNSNDPLKIQGNNIQLKNLDDSDLYFRALTNAQVELYYDNSKKFNTTATGATITGTCNMTSLNCTSSGSTGANFTVGGDLNVTGNIDVADNVKIKLGTGDDLEIYHTGSDSLISNSTGALYLQNTTQGSNVHIRAKFGEESIKAIPDGSVQLYHNNVLKFQTSTDGVDVNSGHLTITDNYKARFGASLDLQIHHDGTNSIIEDINDNPLWIQTDGAIRLTKDSATAYYATFNPGGAVELYFDGVKKFETTSYGSLVTGRLNTTGNIAMPDNAQIHIGDSSDLAIFHDGSNSFIDDTGTGNLVIRSSTIAFENAPGGGESLAKFIGNGAVELYHDNSKKFETTSNGVSISGDLELPDGEELRLGDSNDLQLFHDGSDSNIYNASGNLRIRAANNLQLETHDGEMQIKCVEDGQVELYHNNSKKFETTSAGVTVSGDLTFSDSQANDIHLRGGKIYGDDGALPAFTIQNTTGNSNHSKIVIGDNFGNDNGGITFYGAGSSTTDVKLRIRGTTDTVEISDNHKFVCGDGSDLQIYHDGSDSIIKQTGTGGLILESAVTNEHTIVKAGVNGDFRAYVHNGTLALICNAATQNVELRCGGSKKLETVSHGLFYDGTGGDTYWYDGSGSNDLKWLYTDNVKNCFGTGSDLEIYHDGSKSIIADSGTGHLEINTNNLRVQNAAANETMLYATENGSVQLYHDNTKRIETTSSGISVTGAVYSSTGVFGEGTANNIDFTTDNRMGIHINGSEEFRFESDGDFHADGDVIAFSTTISSDEKLKENIKVVPDALDKVEALRGVTFNWKRDSKSSAGVIAQDVMGVLPEAVKEVQGLNDKESYLSVNYNALTSILVEAIKDLSARIKILEAK